MQKRTLAAIALGACVGLTGCQGAPAPATVTQTVTVAAVPPSTITPGAASSPAAGTPSATAASSKASASPSKGSATPTSTAALGPVSDPQVVTIQELMPLKASSGVNYYTYSTAHPQAPNGMCDVLPSVPSSNVEVYGMYTKAGAPTQPPRISFLMASIGTPSAAHDAFTAMDGGFGTCRSSAIKGTDIPLKVPAAEESRASRFDVTMGNSQVVEYVAAIRVADRLETWDMVVPTAVADEPGALSELLQKAAEKLAKK